MILRRPESYLFFDRPDGDSIYYQSQNPPTSTNQTVRNGAKTGFHALLKAHAEQGLPADAAAFGALDAIDDSGMRAQTFVQLEMGAFVKEVEVVIGEQRHR